MRERITIALGDNWRDLDAWIDGFRRGVRMVRVLDRMEAAIRGEPMNPLPMPPEDYVSKRFQYYVRVDQKEHPALFKYLQFLKERGYSKALALKLLLREAVTLQGFHYQSPGADQTVANAMTSQSGLRMAKPPTPSTELTGTNRTARGEGD